MVPRSPLEPAPRLSFSVPLTLGFLGAPGQCPVSEASARSPAPRPRTGRLRRQAVGTLGGADRPTQPTVEQNGSNCSLLLYLEILIINLL